MTKRGPTVDLNRTRIELKPELKWAKPGLKLTLGKHEG